MTQPVVSPGAQNPDPAQLQRQVAQLSSRNERMSQALVAARDQILALREQLDSLAHAPGSYAVYVGQHESGLVDVLSNGRKMH